MVALAGCIGQPLSQPAPANPANSAAPLPTPAKTVGSAPSEEISPVQGTNGLAAPVSPIHRQSAPTFSWFQAHPFKVAESNSVYAWTAEDGRDTNVILHLAHNQLEYQRMLKENGVIYRRQLVYFAQGFDLLAQQAVQTGQSLHQITLPGLDGQELTVNVTKTDFSHGGTQGQIYGQLPGQSDSVVTVAFIDSREAFTVISPQNQIYLQAEARGPGEVVVKSVNPALYGRPQN
jgi:hypothetical protein